MGFSKTRAVGCILKEILHRTGLPVFGFWHPVWPIEFEFLIEAQPGRQTYSTTADSAVAFCPLPSNLFVLKSNASQTIGVVSPFATPIFGVISRSNKSKGFQLKATGWKPVITRAMTSMVAGFGGVPFGVGWVRELPGPWTRAVRIGRKLPKT